MTFPFGRKTSYYCRMCPRVQPDGHGPMHLGEAAENKVQALHEPANDLSSPGHALHFFLQALFLKPSLLSSPWAPSWPRPPWPSSLTIFPTAAHSGPQAHFSCSRRGSEAKLARWFSPTLCKDSSVLSIAPKIKREKKASQALPDLAPRSLAGCPSEPPKES